MNLITFALDLSPGPIRPTNIVGSYHLVLPVEEISNRLVEAFGYRCLPLSASISCRLMRIRLSPRCTLPSST
jgi:hypothetical protein